MRPTAWWVVLALSGCGGGTAPTPASVEPAPAAPSVKAAEACAPVVAFAAPTEERRSPAAVPMSPELQRTLDLLLGVVREHGRDPANPWAVTHAMLALGADVELTHGRDAVDWLFEEYAEREGAGVGFPVSRGAIRIEPHKDLVLKALTEAGVAPDRGVVVQGEPATVGDLYRQSLCEAWVDGAQTSFGSWNDSPWALQGLAAWAPDGLAWRTSGRDMTVDGLTGAVVDRLHDETAFLRAAIAAGTPVEKRRQGIFGYTCGGAHLLQGAAHAVARGFGDDAHRQHVIDEVPVLYWRLDFELALVDQALSQHPEYGLVLMDQRLKFLGHFLESAHKLAASGLHEPDEAQRQALDRALVELVATVGQLEVAGVLGRLGELKGSNEQLYLDYIGDSAHAARGLQLATGIGVVRL